MRKTTPGFFLLLAIACGTDRSPSPAPTPTPQLYTLSGTITREGAESPVSGALVEITAGVNVGRTATADASGRYTLTGLQAGQFTLRASAPGYAPASQSVTLQGPQTANLSLRLAPFLTTGRVLDVVSNAAIGGVAIAGDDVSALPTDPSGTFSIVSSTDSGDPRLIVFNGATIVERRTHVRVPGPDAAISLIPTSFNLRAFDEMFRVTRLLRWTSAPPLHIETRTLQFTTTGDAEFTALAESLNDGEVGQLQDDLAWALPQLTGGQYSAFDRVTVQQSPESGRVRFLNSGQITVARFAGLTAATGFWGYSRWLIASDSSIYGGTIMLDRDFERSGSGFRRSLRAHELGHALGYNHVTVITSVMNSNARTEPNDFDRLASRVAFQRSPGNRAPDSDPDQYSVNRLGRPIWSVGAK